MSDIPEATVETARRSFWERVSIVWLVPVVALVIALGVAWNSYAERGPLITVIFDDAAGIEVRETELRYRDVAVGVVEDMGFTEGLDQVEVAIRLDKEVAPFVDAEAQFWVVEPEVTTQGVTGLDTVLSGVYIAGLWDTEAGEPVFTFQGLPAAPLLSGGRQGLRVVLRTAGDALSGNVPLVYKGVEVGQVGDASVSLDGFTVEAEAVIYAPYDSLVTEETRFWDISGFSFSVGTGGAAVNFDSISSLIVGGLTFETFVSGAPLAEEGAVYEVYDDEPNARASVFNRVAGPPLTLMAIFDGTVSGLADGANVELDGLRIGQVTAINGVVERDDGGVERVRLQAVLTIQPGRLGFEGVGADAAALGYLEEQVGAGLRARLATGNILTGGLKVQLVTLPDPAPASLDTSAEPYPRLPTAQSEIVDVSASAQATLDRISGLPIEEILASVSSVLDSTSVLLANEDTQALPGEIRGILSDVRGVTGSEPVQALPDQVGALLAEVEDAAASAGAVLAQIEEQNLPQRLIEAVAAVETTLVGVDTALTGVPTLIDEVTALAATARGLPLDALVARLTDVAASTEALLTDEAVAALPGQIGTLSQELQATVAEARALVAGVTEADGAGRLLAAVDSAGAAAASLDAVLADVPPVVARIDRIAAELEALELQATVARVDGVLASTDQLLASEATQALPGEIAQLADELAAAVAETRAVVAAFGEGGGTERALAALDAAARAATSVEQAVDGLPAMVDRIDSVVASAEAVDLQALGTALEELITSAEAILATPDAQELPGNLGDALTELRLILADLREGGAVENTNATLASIRDAADRLATSLDGVPGLIARANTVLGQAGATVDAYGAEGALARDLGATLREVAAAAENIARLARTLERQPNSLILGR